MCMDCYRQYGCPRIDNPLVRATAAAIERVYEVAFAGGPLHVVVDDWNLEDEHIDFCEKDIVPGWDEYGDDNLDVFHDCVAWLRKCSLAERASALALHDGFWGQGG